jgi:hypothetical protein
VIILNFICESQDNDIDCENCGSSIICQIITQDSSIRSLPIYMLDYGSYYREMYSINMEANYNVLT